MATYEKLNLPQYQTNPYYQSSQQALSTLGGGLLSGQLPEYYKGIGEYGGSAFDQMLKGVTSDIQRVVTEDVARRGGKSGLASSVIAREVGKITPQLRWEDYKNTMTNRLQLLGYGADVMSGVRGAGLTEAGQKQSFDLSSLGYGIQQEQFGTQTQLRNEQLAEQQRQFNEQLAFQKEQAEAQAKAQKSQMWSNILSGALGAAGNVFGLGMLSKALGSASTGSGSTGSGLGTIGSGAGGGYDFTKDVKFNY